MQESSCADIAESKAFGFAKLKFIHKQVFVGVDKILKLVEVIIMTLETTIRTLQ